MAVKRRFIGKTVYHKKKRGKNSSIELSLDLGRHEKNISRAQYTLDSAVMASMVRFMPSDADTLVSQTKEKSAFVAGSGRVYAAFGPKGRFLYEGQNMVDESTGSPWARSGARKVLVSQYTGKTLAKESLDLSKSKNPKARPHWFSEAKNADLDKWVEITKKTAGGSR